MKFSILMVLYVPFTLGTADSINHQNVVIEEESDIENEEPKQRDDRKNHGAELTSLAHNSAIQAENAVQNQHTAGSQAAYGIKSSLADAALGAAQTAQAALIGKQAIVGALKRELKKTEHQLDGEVALYQQAANAAHAAQEAAQQAEDQLSTLKTAVTAAQAGVHFAERTAALAKIAEATQKNMIAESEYRIHRVLMQIQKAYIDLKETEASAHKASQVAEIVKSNVADEEKKYD